MRTLRNQSIRLACSLVAVGTLAVATPAAADVVTDWNALAVQFVNAAGRPPGASANLDLAMVHVAIHDAVQAYQHRFRTYGPPVPGAGGSPIAAAAAAAHDMLVARFQIPSTNAGLIAQVDTAFTNYLTAKGLAINDAGVAVGQQAALNLVLKRANDGFFPANPETFTGSTEPGQWRPTPPAFAPMATPWLGNVTPFVLKDREGVLNEPDPPLLTSGRYARDYNEVKAMGRRTGSARTPQQTTMALFFSGNFQTILNGVLRSVATARLTDIGDSARLFALALVSSADTGINVWNNQTHLQLLAAELGDPERGRRRQFSHGARRRVAAAHQRSAVSGLHLRREREHRCHRTRSPELLRRRRVDVRRNHQCH